jgi:hypothetical protein
MSLTRTSNDGLSGIAADYKARVHREIAAMRQEINAAKFKYKIELGVPLPAVQKHKRRKVPHQSTWLYPLRIMKVGDSFFVPVTDYPDRTGWLNIGAAVNTAQQREDKRFCWRTRTLADHGEEGWRVWRTK